MSEPTALSAPLQELAQRYIAARRRSGETLLDAAAALADARTQAQHGEWYTFLQATQTTAATAERLLNIHRLARENLQFAGFVADNWIGMSAAALLARPSTPSAAIDAVLSGERQPSVADVERAIREAHEAEQVTPEVTEVDAPTAAEIARLTAELRAFDAHLYSNFAAMGSNLQDIQRVLTREQFDAYLQSKALTPENAHWFMELSNQGGTHLFAGDIPDQIWEYFMRLWRAEQIG